MKSCEGGVEAEKKTNRVYQPPKRFKEGSEEGITWQLEDREMTASKELGVDGESFGVDHR